MIIDSIPKFELPLTYRIVLPRLWFLTFVKDRLYIESDKKYYPLSQNIYKHLLIFQSNIENPPNKATQRLQKDTCVYCKRPNHFNGDGDHVVNKKIRTQIRSLDSLSFRYNCCRQCNSSKLNKDLLFWWIIKKEKSVLDLSMDLIHLYSKATWLVQKSQNNLDGLVPEEYLKAVNQLHLTIDQESYNSIWAKPKGLDAF